nr:hypothetical protein [Tanacetum cinerariifolium]
MTSKLPNSTALENASNKRKWESNHNGSLSQQNKGHNVPRAHTAWPINKKAYDGSLSLCNQCKFHHSGPCTVKCGNYKKVGHIIQNCRTPATAKNQRTRTCYECRSLRHYKSECPIVKFHKRVDMIHGKVRESKPNTMQDAIEIATKLRNKKISTLAECQTENKKRLDNTSKNNQNQQQPNKRQYTGRAYTARHGEKKHYSGSKPLCSKCNYHHDGLCAPKCHKCNRFGHLACDCRSSINANTTNIQKGTGVSQKATCYERGNQGHYKRDSENASNKRKWEGNHNGSLSQQNKGHKVPRAHTAWPINKKAYDGSLPLCNQCKLHHSRPCTVKYENYKKVGHIIQNIKTPATAKNQRTRTCCEYESLGHYKSECPIGKFPEHVDMIHGRMRVSKPKTMQDAMEIATKLRNKQTSTLVECETENKKRLDNTSKNNQNQQQPNKRQNTGRAYTARHGEKKHYNGSNPLCSKCNYHHDGPCAPKCH